MTKPGSHVRQLPGDDALASDSFGSRDATLRSSPRGQPHFKKGLNAQRVSVRLVLLVQSVATATSRHDWYRKKVICCCRGDFSRRPGSYFLPYPES